MIRVFDRQRDHIIDLVALAIQLLGPFAVLCVGKVGKGPVVALPIPLKTPILAQLLVGQ